MTKRVYTGALSTPSVLELLERARTATCEDTAAEAGEPSPVLTPGADRTGAPIGTAVRFILPPRRCISLAANLPGALDLGVASALAAAVDLSLSTRCFLSGPPGLPGVTGAPAIVIGRTVSIRGTGGALNIVPTEAAAVGMPSISSSVAISVDDRLGGAGGALAEALVEAASLILRPLLVLACVK